MRRALARRAYLVAWASLLGSLVPSALAEAAPGELDPTFGPEQNGTVTTSGLAGASAMLVQPDGKLVAVGSTGSGQLNRDIALARYRPDGTLDDSFGVGGTVVSDFGADEDASAVAIQADGKLVVAGRAGGLDFLLARYNPDGSLDDGTPTDSTPEDSFGVAGQVITDFGGRMDRPYAVLIQPVDGEDRIVAAGRAHRAALGLSDSDFALARYHANGMPDESFGVGGQVLTDISGAGGTPDIIWALALQPTLIDPDTGQPEYRLVAAGEAFEDFAVAAYDETGGLDLSFGPAPGGYVMTEFTNLSVEAAKGVAVQADGKLVAAGHTDTGGGANEDFALVRYNADGRLDDGTISDSTPGDSFGLGARVITDFGESRRDFGYGVAIDGRDGKLVVGGASAVPPTQNPMQTFEAFFALARYEPDGTLDVGFGGDGKVTGDFGHPASSQLDDTRPSMWSMGVAVQPDGKPVLAGGAAEGGFALARYLADPDITPPETTITAGPSGVTADNSPTFEFSSSEAGSSFECRVDSAAFASCASPHTTGLLADGAHSFEVRATDTAGNTDGTPASRAFTVDTPDVGIGDRKSKEGNSGTTEFSFAVSLSAPSSEPVTVAFATADGTAVAPGDYLAASGTVTFSPGETAKTVTVSVNGDRTRERTERFYVDLSGPDNVTIVDGRGVGTIVNDD